MKPVVPLVLFALAILPGRQNGERVVLSNTAPAENAKRETSNDRAADPTVVAAGDIADCKTLSGAEATAKLLDTIPGTVLPRN